MESRTHCAKVSGGHGVSSKDSNVRELDLNKRRCMSARCRRLSYCIHTEETDTVGAARLSYYVSFPS